MARVAVLTLHRPLNFGSALQTVALVRALLSAGHEVSVVDYRPSRWTTPAHFRAWWAERSELGVARRLANASTRSLEMVRARPAFDRYYDRAGVAMTRVYRDVGELRDDPPPADAYVVGSDQVWNSVYNLGVDEAFYLAFGPPATARVAYAASLGHERVPAGEAPRVARLLDAFTGLSVREATAVEALARIGHEAAHVVDPTLLIDGTTWAAAADRVPGEPYVLTYCVEESNAGFVRDLAVAVAARAGLQIRNVSFGGPWRAVPGALNHHYASPSDFLSLLAGSAFVVTSSFHGAAFSVNLEKPFFAVPPPRFDGRLASLLASVGLVGRAVTANTLSAVPELSLDFSTARRRLSIMRERSAGFLRSSVDSNST